VSSIGPLGVSGLQVAFGLYVVVLTAVLLIVLRLSGSPALADDGRPV
jgi:hypothetical protein